jgi:hypothetical protein
MNTLATNVHCKISSIHCMQLDFPLELVSQLGKLHISHHFFLLHEHCQWSDTK